MGRAQNQIKDSFKLKGSSLKEAGPGQKELRKVFFNELGGRSIFNNRSDGGTLEPGST